MTSEEMHAIDRAYQAVYADCEYIEGDYAKIKARGALNRFYAQIVELMERSVDEESTERTD